MTALGSHGIIIQGITGREARMVAGHMLAYGSPLIAGVTPGKGGQQVAGVPVFDNVAQSIASATTAIDSTLISVPPFAVLDAGIEALDAGIGTLVIATEGVPRHDVVRLLASAGDAGALVVGPNSVGVITPRLRRKVGAIGGENPDRAFVPGQVGVASRSGGMTSEIGLTLRLAGKGVSTAISIGGDEIIGTPTLQAVELLQLDVETRVVCIFGEPGTTFEEDLAQAIQAGRISVPVVALVSGLFGEHLPEGTAFGHAAAIISDGAGRPSDKRGVLAASGARVVDTLAEMADVVVDILDAS